MTGTEPSTVTETWSLQTIAPHARDSTVEVDLAQDTPGPPAPAGHAFKSQNLSSQSHTTPPPLAASEGINATSESIPQAGTNIAVEEADEPIPPENAAEDMRPTRRYQALLLLAGFMMIFQVIGINQTYGIFQVS